MLSAMIRGASTEGVSVFENGSDKSSRVAAGGRTENEEHQSKKEVEEGTVRWSSVKKFDHTTARRPSDLQRTIENENWKVDRCSS